MPLPPTRERPALPTAPDYVPPGAVDEPRRRRRWRRRLGIALVTVLGLGVVAAAAAYVILDHQINEFIQPDSADLVDAQKRLQRPLPGEPANILVMGSDFRASDQAEGKRSDTILLVRLDPERGTISMLSFPRDLWVDIPGYGTSKINDAYSEGGSQLTVETLRELTGLDIHFIATVDFRGFRGIVNELGGVWVDVDQRYFNDNSSGENYAEIDIQPGYQKLRGEDALAYARFRHTDSDFHRIARQQSVLRELKRQVGMSDLAVNAPGLFEVMDKNTDMAAGGNGQISVRTAVDYLRLALSLKSGDVYQFHVEGELGTADNGASIITASDAEISGLVDAFLNPDPEARRKAADLATGETTAPGTDGADGDESSEPAAKPTPADAVGDVPLTVFNGNGIANSADAAGAALTAEGLTVEVAGNADNFEYATTTIYYGAPSDKPAADAVAELFSDAEVVEAPSTSTFAQHRISVVVGATGEVATAASEGLSPAVPPEERVVPANQVVPEKAEAAVITDPAWRADEFAELRRRADMPVMVPTTRESSSDIVGDVRIYRVIRSQKAYRMVLRTSQGAYWGIQGTEWDAPPMIDDPNRTVERNGRKLLIFLDGTKIRMIAWRMRGGVFWVSNSVLNELSNETMMSIAAGATLVTPRGIQ